MDMQQNDMQIRKQKILDEFDFHKVRKAMKAVGWKWGVTRKGCHKLDLPTIDELKEQAIRLLQEVMTRDTTISCGGFEASKNDNLLSLKFCIDSKRIYKFGEEYINW